MNIGIVGLGLIGGSYARCLSKRTNHSVYGMTRNAAIISKAMEEGTIKGEIKQSELSLINYFIIALPPEATIDFITSNINNFAKGTIITDICGIKSAIKDKVAKLCSDNRIWYVGTHPMAGRECSGYNNSLESLFDGRSLIIMNDNNIPDNIISTVADINKAAGFSRIVYTSSSHHDEIIAYTSQLCHISSNAFVKSPTAKEHLGYSGGSFEDLTRVAFLDPDLWTELFFMNKEPLLKELSSYINELKKYERALADNDAESMRELLNEGRIIKESISKSKNTL